MSGTGSGHMPENLAFGAALSSLSFLCTAVMSALAKATEELTSTAVVLLFQNLICLLILVPIALIEVGSLRTDGSVCTYCALSAGRPPGTRFLSPSQ